MKLGRESIVRHSRGIKAETYGLDIIIFHCMNCEIRKDKKNISMYYFIAKNRKQETLYLILIKNRNQSLLITSNYTITFEFLILVM